MILSEIQKYAQFLSDNYEFKEIVIEGDCTIHKMSVEVTPTGYATRISLRKLKNENK